VHNRQHDAAHISHYMQHGSSCIAAQKRTLLTAAVGLKAVAVGLTRGGASSLQLINGSCTNASNIAITLSLFARSTLITSSHVLLKLPSIRLTCLACIDYAAKVIVTMLLSNQFKIQAAACTYETDTNILQQSMEYIAAE
jgi:hypothetical protein